jgi:hypothetical protein
MKEITPMSTSEDVRLGLLIKGMAKGGKKPHGTNKDEIFRMYIVGDNGSRRQK